MLFSRLRALFEKLQLSKTRDGKIFVYPVETVVRIRTWERNENAL
nr:P-II family nitrogen regulator [Petroclostridium xylanilyticum]